LLLMAEAGSIYFFFFSSRRRHTRSLRDWSSDVCSSDLTVIKEAAASFSPEPGVNRWRPRQQTSVPRLFLAGDWTETGWPATMERSEERRVGKECRIRGATCDWKKKLGE